MFHRTNRVWFGATRTVVFALLFIALIAVSASQSYGYMPPPILKPNIVPDEFPDEGQQQITGQLPDRSQVGEYGAPSEQDQYTGHEPLVGRFIHQIFQLLGRLAGGR